ncbi:hypothetical protein BC777_0699 [Yoonia maricola]|uniref:Alpha 1,4-glycosyltransferase n=1 Tax=Yoonia maricola TaxID=420999 RepID=A0A2M8WLR1_9RHOB|nr:hypothetical protein [Yoonia maricola]PJI91858.1 hypothetical protein BC777_0699 [Yoonia maricola]
MSKLPTIGALWIGGSLTWLEQLCLKSFVEHGHEVLLFTYGEVKNVPDGVKVRDGREIVATDDFVLHSRSQSVALFSDLFRFHMIKTIPEIIYIDTDVFCLKPLDFEDPYIFGYEKYRNAKAWRINGAILRLPPTSLILHEMLDFMTDEYPQPAWISGRFQAEMKARAAAGDPMHVGELPWGIWGPIGITAFARATGEYTHAKSLDVLYPVPFKERRVLFKRPMKTLQYLTADSHTIHMWAPIKKLSAARHDGLCPPGSYIGRQLIKYGIDQEKARVPKTFRREVSLD